MSLQIFTRDPGFIGDLPKDTAEEEVLMSEEGLTVAQEAIKGGLKNHEVGEKVLGLQELNQDVLSKLYRQAQALKSSVSEQFERLSNGALKLARELQLATTKPELDKFKEEFEDDMETVFNELSWRLDEVSDDLIYFANRPEIKKLKILVSRILSKLLDGLNEIGNDLRKSEGVQKLEELHGQINNMVETCLEPLSEIMEEISADLEEIADSPEAKFLVNTIDQMFELISNRMVKIEAHLRQIDVLEKMSQLRIGIEKMLTPLSKGLEKLANELHKASSGAEIAKLQALGAQIIENLNGGIHKLEDNLRESGILHKIESLKTSIEELIAPILKDLHKMAAKMHQALPDTEKLQAAADKMLKKLSKEMNKLESSLREGGAEVKIKELQTGIGKMLEPLTNSLQKLGQELQHAAARPEVQKLQTDAHKMMQVLSKGLRKFENDLRQTEVIQKMEIGFAAIEIIFEDISVALQKLIRDLESALHRPDVQRLKTVVSKLPAMMVKKFNKLEDDLRSIDIGEKIEAVMTRVQEILDPLVENLKKLADDIQTVAEPEIAKLKTHIAKMARTAIKEFGKLKNEMLEIDVMEKLHDGIQQMLSPLASGLENLIDKLLELTAENE